MPRRMSPAAPCAEEPGSAPRVVVLLVDDDPAALRIGVRALAQSGFCVISAKNGLEALQVYREQQAEIALVILDMTMPMLGGVDTFYQLCAISPDVRVILLTGYESGYAAQSFGTRAPLGYVQKPYRIPVLIDAVKRGLEQGE